MDVYPRGVFRIQLQGIKAVEGALGQQVKVHMSGNATELLLRPNITPQVVNWQVSSHNIFFYPSRAQVVTYDYAEEGGEGCRA